MTFLCILNDTLLRHIDNNFKNNNCISNEVHHVFTYDYGVFIRFMN